MKITSKLAASLTLLSFVFFTSGFAQQVSKPKPGHTGSWRILGHTQANHSADHDIIIIKGPFDYFRRLKFKVTDAPLQMRRMLVRYDDGGGPEDIDIRYNIPQGGESRVIDLKGGKRKLKSIEFWYDTKGFLRGKANVTLLGIK
jgi:hypothetical protein